MKKYDDIVVGSGISGMTMALILGMNGRKVRLLEKSPFIGGSVARFYKQGIPFDTGFHFTGGLQEGGILDDVLSVLEIRDMIEPIFLSHEHSNCFFLESEDRQYEIPYGSEEVKAKLKEYFPDEADGIDRYFSMVQAVCDNTPSMNLQNLFSQQHTLDEDFLSLEEGLNRLTQNRTLKALLSAFAMCYGVRPDEISFANHSRMCQGLYQSVARVKNGGDAFVKAFKAKFKEYDIEVSNSTYIKSLEGISNKKVGSFILNTGEEITAENCIFTIHPKEILSLLPEKSISRAFVDRVSSFESSVGFFSVFAVLESDDEEPDFDSSIFSIFPHNDVNRLLAPDNNNGNALVIIKSIEQSRGKTYRTINAFEPSFIEEVEQWKDSKTGKRPPAYQEYKKKRVEEIVNRVLKAFPQYRGKLKVIDSASVLTFRDYLNSPDGSAYGIKQKLNQLNLMGKLPLHNLFATGQSALLPGIIGAMMSSFIVGRAMLDEEKYNKFLLKNLDR